VGRQKGLFMTCHVVPLHLQSLELGDMNAQSHFCRYGMYSFQ